MPGRLAGVSKEKTEKINEEQDRGYLHNEPDIIAK
jgi:hypothetical protein